MRAANEIQSGRLKEAPLKIYTYMWPRPAEFMEYRREGFPSSYRKRMKNGFMFLGLKWTRIPSPLDPLYVDPNCKLTTIEVGEKINVASEKVWERPARVKYREGNHKFWIAIELAAGELVEY